MKKYKLIILIALITSIVINTSCEEEDQPISNDLRLLTATINGENVKNEVATIDAEGQVSMELVFSHTLSSEAFESAFSVSNNASYSVSYDETNSFVTITFQGLAFETDYTATITAGDLGVDSEPLTETWVLNFTSSAYVPPVVTLSTDNSNLLEGESSTITASIDKEALDDVVVNLSIAGSATPESDYTLASSITIPMGETSASTSISLNNDSEIEGEETLILTIESITNALESGTQEITFSFNDELPALTLKGVMAMRWSTETDGNSGKAVHLVALEDIADLSEYSIGVANNGGGTDGIEYTFPAIAVNAGEDILLAREPSALQAYFGGCYDSFEHVIQTDEMSQNGDDAIELFKGSAVIETYGDADVDGTDQDWEYTSSWAYKLGETWTSGMVNCTAGSTTTNDSGCIYPICDNPLILKGVLALLWDGSGTNGGKAVHLVATRDIADLSVYGLGVANNGGGTDGVEFTFPSIAVSEGENVLLAREQNTISGYFEGCFDGFNHVIETDAMNQNGDDAIELFSGTDIIEVFGDADVDGTDQPWDYSGSWAFKIGSTWTYGGVDCAATATTNATSECVYTFCE
ncbi:MAG: nuclease [Flammeovirgaceae bacterium]|nr:nuclease [Flammeovirgaceae bacterium]MBR10984.1 nuclease [Rickettsiales bacterium]